MPRPTLLAAAALVALVGTWPPVRSAEPEVHWPSFRGPAASGVARGFATPVNWDVAKSEGVLWKTRIPGLAHSSPVVWGDRIFVTSAVGEKTDPTLRVGLYGDIDPVTDDTKQRFVVSCLDKKSGKLLWERTAHEGLPAIKRHTKSTHANPTPATDGKHVVAFFGSEGLYCYDMQGHLEWKKSFGVLDAGYFEAPEAQWGFGSSPVIDGDRVIVQCDVQKDPFLAALRLADGEIVWRTAREDVPTWSTPAVVRSGGRAQVVVNGFKQMAGYDLATGKLLWRMKGGGDIPVPTPVFGHELIFITNAHGGSGLYAIRPGASGDISLAAGATSSEQVAWSARAASYMQTPLVYGEHLYVCRDNGVLSVHEARTGKRLHQARLGSGTSGFTASGVAADGKLYYTSEEGAVYVLRAGAVPELLATNELGEITMATPAISAGVLYFRTRDHLVAIGAQPTASGG